MQTPSSSSANKQPHILLITTDEQRFDTYGLANSAWPQMPNMSRLRNEGTTLTNAYSNSPVCMPCRYGWMTGLYNSQTERGPNNGYDWPDYHPTMPQALQKAGYHTALFGKLHAFNAGKLRSNHLNDLHDHNMKWGFDTLWECSGRDIWSYVFKDNVIGIQGCNYTDYLRKNGLYDQALAHNVMRSHHRKANQGREPFLPGVLQAKDSMDAVVANELCSFINTYNNEAPLYLHASFFGPHYPTDASQEYLDKYNPDDMPVPHGLSDPQEIRLWQQNRAMYMAITNVVDDQIGRVLTALEQRGWLDDTIILFTTDHGDMQGDFHLYQKRYPYEGAARTPILIRHPATIAAGVTLQSPVESVDVPNTILAAAGLDEKIRTKSLPFSPGRSFLQYARQQTSDFRDSAYVEMGDEASARTCRMLRQGDWKYVHWAAMSHCLFNLKEDLGELNNLVNDPIHAGRVCQMKSDLLDRMTNIHNPPIQGKHRMIDVPTRKMI